MSAQPPEVVLVVDVANVLGSRPDGWWRHRAAATARLLGSLESVNGSEVPVPFGVGAVRISEVRAVLEGAARRAEGPQTLLILLAERDGDTEIVEEASRLTAAGKTPLVVTADRGLRARLPEPALVVGPGWLNQLLGR